MLTCAGLAFSLSLFQQAHYFQNIRSMLSEAQQQQLLVYPLIIGLSSGLTLFLVFLLAGTLLSDRKMHAQLEQNLLDIENRAAARERSRIARDIHDSLGYALTTLNIQLQTADKLWNVSPAQAHPFLKQSQRLGEIAIEEVRRSVGTLRIEGKQENSLDLSIEALIKDFRQSTKISITTDIELDAVLPIHVYRALYRIVQEALINIYKHAQSTKVYIRLCASPHKVFLTIKDNGKGFRPNLEPAGFGLQGMQERVVELKGDFRLETQPGAGCQITVEMPTQEVLS
jgi:signal transduction histidine kinase